MTTAAMLLCTILTFSACDLQSLTPQDSTTTQAPATIDVAVTTAPQTTSETPPPPDAYFYLTGMPAPDASVANARPIALCIGNSASSLPQIGLSYADMLVEVPVEGGLTRLAMLTSLIGDRMTVGSIRSTRPYLSAILNDFSAVAVFAGSTDQVGAPTETIPGDSIDALSTDFDSFFYRDDGRASSLGFEHALMSDGERLKNALESLDVTSTLSALPYHVRNGQTRTPTYASAESILLPFSSLQTVEWRYDGETGQYIRYQNGILHQSDGKPLTYQNVLLLYTYATTSETSFGTTLSLDVQSGGAGFYASGGKYEPIRWERNESGALRILSEDGERLEISAGKTYLALARTAMKDAVVIR